MLEWLKLKANTTQIGKDMNQLELTYIAEGNAKW